MIEYTPYKVQARQSIYDVAIQCYGSIEAVVVVLNDNPTLSINSNIEGMIIQVRQSHEGVSLIDPITAKWFRDNQKMVNNDSLESDFYLAWVDDEGNPWINEINQVFLY